MLENKNIKLIALDVDGTLVHYDRGDFGSSWDTLSYSLGVFDEIQELLKEYYPQREKHREWTEKEILLYKGKKVKDTHKHLYPIPYSAGAREFANKSKGKLIRGILSTSIDLVAKKISDELSFDFCLCNVLGRENGEFNGEIDYIVPLWEKHLVLEEFCKKEGVSLENVAYVGDHENDLTCFEIVGLSIAFNPKKLEVGEKANHVISDFRQLNEILNLK